MNFRTGLISKVCALILLTLPTSLWAQIHDTPAVNAPRAFVEDFYTWYASYLKSTKPMPSWDIALKLKKSEFEPRLARLLEQDRAAQDKCRELVGLDFDPFLNTQDPADHYVVGQIAKLNQHFVVSVYSVRFGEKSKEPPLRAEVSQRNGHWFFVDFLYPDGPSLVSLLKLPKLPCSVPVTPGNR